MPENRTQDWLRHSGPDGLIHSPELNPLERMLKVYLKHCPKPKMIDKRSRVYDRQNCKFSKRLKAFAAVKGGHYVRNNCSVVPLYFRFNDVILLRLNIF